jgi:peptidoglycan/LPS O-acetylase OafA/YrhL
MAHGTPYSYLSPLVFACAIAVFANSNGALSRGLQTTPFLNLGTWSYSIYMTHIFILSAANMLSRMIEKVAAARHVGDQWRAAIAAPGVSDALCFLFALVVIGVSSQTFRWIEAPAQRFFNARARALT